MNHAKDVKTINECYQQDAGVKKDGTAVKLESVPQRSGGSSSSKTTRIKNKPLSSTPKTPSRKRKREMEEDEMTSASETGSDKSASEIKPGLKKTPQHKVRTRPPQYNNSDSEGGKMLRAFDSDDSDGEYRLNRD